MTAVGSIVALTAGCKPSLTRAASLLPSLTTARIKGVIKGVAVPEGPNCSGWSGVHPEGQVQVFSLPVLIRVSHIEAAG